MEKFLQAAEIQRENPANIFTIVSSAPNDDTTVYLTEAWTSEAAHTAATESAEVLVWAADMPDLVAGPPEIAVLTLEGGAASGQRIET